MERLKDLEDIARDTETLLQRRLAGKSEVTGGDLRRLTAGIATKIASVFEDTTARSHICHDMNNAFAAFSGGIGLIDAGEDPPDSFSPLLLLRIQYNIRGILARLGSNEKPHHMRGDDILRFLHMSMLTLPNKITLDNQGGDTSQNIYEFWPGTVYTLIFNCIRNAILRGGASHIDISFEENEKGGFITLADNGTGFSNNLNIYGYGISGHGSTGIGLAGADTITERMGGRLSHNGHGGLENNNGGKGAVFYIGLPLSSKFHAGEDVSNTLTPFRQGAAELQEPILLQA